MDKIGHRPAQYPQTAEGLSCFKDKSNQYAETAAELSVEEWASYMGISRVTLSNYKKRGREWKETIETALRYIKSHRCEQISARQGE